MPESVLMMFGMLLTILIGTAIIIVIVVNLREMEKKEHTGSGKANLRVGKCSYVAAQEYIFPINNGRCAVDYAVNQFGRLCCAIARVIPEVKRASVTYKISVSRQAHNITMSIDTGFPRIVNLRRILPGYRYYEMCGWQGNENYLEGILDYSYLPDAWEGFSVNEYIIREFKKQCPDVAITSQFDDIEKSGLASIVFKIW